MAGGKSEYVAGCLDRKNSYNTYIYNAEDKYKDVYESEDLATAYKPGDATYETKKWKGASYGYATWSWPMYFRSGQGVFYFTVSSRAGGGDSSYSTRAALVCGVGL